MRHVKISRQGLKDVDFLSGITIFWFTVPTDLSLGLTPLVTFRGVLQLRYNFNVESAQCAG